MNEALKYQGWKYVYGGSNPNTSFDCSGLTQYNVYGCTATFHLYDCQQHIDILGNTVFSGILFYHRLMFQNFGG